MTPLGSSPAVSLFLLTPVACGPSFSLGCVPAAVQTCLGVSDRPVGTGLPRTLLQERILQKEKRNTGPPKSAQGPNLRGQRGGVSESYVNPRQR